MASEHGNLFPLRRLDMLKCHMKELNPEVVDILSGKDPGFAGLRSMRDTVARQLCEAGVGATVNLHL